MILAARMQLAPQQCNHYVEATSVKIEPPHRRIQHEDHKSVHHNFKNHLKIKQQKNSRVGRSNTNSVQRLQNSVQGLQASYDDII
jgi:hypothetical protein